jgi:hypothetical protein
MTAPSIPRKRNRGTPAGVIWADAVYTAQALNREFGIGRGAIIEARQAGVIKPRLRSGRLYYLGSEVIEWIKNGPTPVAKEVTAESA